MEQIRVQVHSHGSMDFMTIESVNYIGRLCLDRDAVLELLEKINENLGQMRVNVGQQTKETK